MRIEPLTAALGAELLDVNLEELDSETASELRRLLVEGDLPVAAS